MIRLGFEILPVEWMDGAINADHGPNPCPVFQQSCTYRSELLAIDKEKNMMELRIE
jgi:hypothetical protein